MRVGIIGTGAIAAIHAGNARRIPGIELTVVSSQDEARAEAFAQRYGISLWEGTHEGIFNHELDAVLICSTTETHCPLIALAAENGIHVFCEKPIGVSIPDIDRTLKTVRENGILLQVGYNRRFDPLFSRLKAILDRSDSWRVEQIHVVSRDPRAPSPENITVPYALVSETMVHDLDMAWYLGGPVRSVAVVGGTLLGLVFAEHEQIDTAQAQIHFESGALCSIQNSWRSTDGYDQRIEVFTSNGALFAPNPSADMPERFLELGVWQFPTFIRGFFPERYAESYRLELDAFFKSVHHNEQPLVTGDDARYTALLVEAAKASVAIDGGRVFLRDL